MQADDTHDNAPDAPEERPCPDTQEQPGWKALHVGYYPEDHRAEYLEDAKHLFAVTGHERTICTAFVQRIPDWQQRLAVGARVGRSDAAARIARVRSQVVRNGGPTPGEGFDPFGRIKRAGLGAGANYRVPVEGRPPGRKGAGKELDREKRAGKECELEKRAGKECANELPVEHCLPVQVGDVLEVLCASGAWWLARNEHGRYGLVSPATLHLHTDDLLQLGLIH